MHATRHIILLDSQQLLRYKYLNGIATLPYDKGPLTTSRSFKTTRYNVIENTRIISIPIRVHRISTHSACTKSRNFSIFISKQVKKNSSKVANFFQSFIKCGIEISLSTPPLFPDLASNWHLEWRSGETLKLPLIKRVELTVISRGETRGVVSRRRLDLDA